MPRVSYVTNELFRAGEQDHSPENENLDFCKSCFRDFSKFILKELVNTKWFDVDCEHPPYNETNYECESCGESLEDKDN